jgi:hypothetical protein
LSLSLNYLESEDHLQIFVKSILTDYDSILPSDLREILTTLISNSAEVKQAAILRSPRISRPEHRQEKNLYLESDNIKSVRFYAEYSRNSDFREKINILASHLFRNNLVSNFLIAVLDEFSTVADSISSINAEVVRAVEFVSIDPSAFDEE